MLNRGIAVLSLALLIAGCSRSVTYTTPDGQKVTVDQGGKPGQAPVTISSKEGTVTLNPAGGKLPNDFPKDVPVPSPAKIIMSTSVNTGPNVGFQVSLESADTVDNLTAFLKKGLTDNGWTINQTTTLPTMTVMGATKEKRELSVQIVDADGKRMVTETAMTAKP